MKTIKRREFFKYIGAFVGVTGISILSKYAALPLLRGDNDKLYASSSSDQPSTKRTNQAVDGFDTIVDPTKKFAMVIDIGACIGCRRCQWGCKEENNIPDTISPPWIEVFQLDEEVTLTGNPHLKELNHGATTSYTVSPLEGKRYLPVQCNHCDNPPCVKVCPTGATFKDKDGYVLMNYDRCIGCRFCVVSCPYSNRRFNWFKPEHNLEDINPEVPGRPIGVAEKCTFCVHRTRKGRLPRCVEVCPVNARHFGDLNDPESEVSKLLSSNLNFRLLEELGTAPRIYYITRGKKFLE